MAGIFLQPPADPYRTRAQQGLAGWFTAPLSEAALGEIPVVPAGPGGNLIYRPDATHWLSGDTATKAQMLKDGKTGWILGNDGIISKTENGSDFSALEISKSDPAPVIRDFQFLDDKTGWAVGE